MSRTSLPSRLSSTDVAGMACTPEPAAAEDVAAVTRQLGRSPRGMLAVVGRSRFGAPQVVLTAPLLLEHAGAGDPNTGHSEPAHLQVFPTQFWLTCPFLIAAIADMEASGAIESLEERLDTDFRFRRAMIEAHAEAAALRRGLVPESGWRLLDESRHRGQRRVITESGVAGIRWKERGDIGGVKCLHAHYADWVGRGANPVGEWVRDRLAEREHPMACDDRCLARCLGVQAASDGGA